MDVSLPLWLSSDWDEGEGSFNLMGLIVVLPILLLTWFIAGHRNQMVIFDLDEKKLTRNATARFPLRSNVCGKDLTFAASVLTIMFEPVSILQEEAMTGRCNTGPPRIPVSI